MITYSCILSGSYYILAWINFTSSDMSAQRIAKAAIKIPKRIERGPTDILKALASTVNFIAKEPSAFLQDDPYLLPIRPTDKGVYCLAKLNGKSTAKFILNKYPEWFHRDDAEPKVEAFLPPEELRLDMELTEDDLIWCIDNNDITNGLIAYQSIQEKGIKISDETLLNFFEFVCYSNEDKRLDEFEFARKYFSRDNNLVNQTWKINGLASKIFNQIKEDLDPPRVYSAMIAGLSKYNEHETAKQVFEDFKEAHPDKGLFTEAYRGLLDSIRSLYSSAETAHEAMNKIVQHLQQHEVTPTLEIFNSMLNIYRSYQCDDEKIENAMKLINDMLALNIQPSLATYDQIINILNKIRRGHTEQLDDLFNYVASQDSLLEVRDDRDLLFFRSVMRLSCQNPPNIRRANKLHKMFLKKPNLFPDENFRNTFLDLYFKLMVTTEKLETTLSFYDEYVPMLLRPSSESYDVLAEALDLYQADEETIKRIGLDIIDFKRADSIKNDAIFRKFPEYEAELERQLSRRNKYST